MSKTTKTPTRADLLREVVDLCRWLPAAYLKAATEDRKTREDIDQLRRWLADPETFPDPEGLLAADLETQRQYLRRMEQSRMEKEKHRERLWDLTCRTMPDVAVELRLIREAVHYGQTGVEALADEMAAVEASARRAMAARADTATPKALNRTARRILLILKGKRMLMTREELAVEAKVSPATAKKHCTKLIEQGLAEAGENNRGVRLTPAGRDHVAED